MQVGEIISFGAYKWRVLEIRNNSALLITEHIIEQRPYNQTAGEVTWADSSLRNYLNGAFFNGFTPIEQMKIQLVCNQNPNNPWYGSKGGVDTWDHVFLLNLEEVVCQYFGDSRKNLENRSEKQKYWFQKKDENNLKRRATYQGSSWWWWLRSQGRDNRRAVYIHGDGNVGIQGNGTYRYNSNTIHPVTHDNSGGVRPCLWLKVSE